MRTRLLFPNYGFNLCYSPSFTAIYWLRLNRLIVGPGINPFLFYSIYLGATSFDKTIVSAGLGRLVFLSVLNLFDSLLAFQHRYIILSYWWKEKKKGFFGSEGKRRCRQRSSLSACDDSPQDSCVSSESPGKE